MIKKYTLGIAFDHNAEIILIQKTKPTWQAGRLNFVGGKIERGETPVQCISREFKEETSVLIEPENWKYVGKMVRKKDFIVYIYVTVDKRVSEAKTTTEENIFHVTTETFEINSTLATQMMPNLKVMYEFVKSDDFIINKATLNIEFPPIV